MLFIYSIANALGFGRESTPRRAELIHVIAYTAFAWFSWVSSQELCLNCGWGDEASFQTLKLSPAVSPADNPLKGLVPYADANIDAFPHSLEFQYIRWSDLVIAEDQYKWDMLDRLLDKVAARGCQSVIRVWIEYPGKPTGVPLFLQRQGVKIIKWVNREERPAVSQQTPDYRDERLITAIEKFIAAFGARYDGDPRLGFITAGLLGEWGEWHTWPREELFATKEVQARVLHAYEASFKRTPVLLRYPAGADDSHFAANDQRPFGYHDDSFAWATLSTSRAEDSWFYMSALRAAGPRAEAKWKTSPIGGEIRPELWGQIFDSSPAHPQAQDFLQCIEQTHVTWLMESGLFADQANPQRITRAKAFVARMGYDFYVPTAEIRRSESGKLNVRVSMINQGVAPFYANWPIELALLGSNRELVGQHQVDWKLTSVMPDSEPQRFEAKIDAMPVVPQDKISSSLILLMRVVHPLPSGKPLRFANASQDQHLPGWLTLGAVPSETSE